MAEKLCTLSLVEPAGEAVSGTTQGGIHLGLQALPLTVRA